MNDSVLSELPEETKSPLRCGAPGEEDLWERVEVTGAVPL